MTPTPNEISNLESVIPEKNFSEISKTPVSEIAVPPSLLPNSPMALPKKRIKGTHILPAHRIIFENYRAGGFKSLAKAIRQTGVYAETTAERTNVIKKSRSWQLLMDEVMPEEHLLLRHSELLDKRDVRVIQNDDGQDIEVDNGPDTAAVSKGLELAYKLRGSFREKEPEAPRTVMYNLFYKPEVREQMKVFEDGIKQSLLYEINKRNMADIETEEENQANIERVRSGEFEESVEQRGADTATGGGTESSVSGGDDGGGVSGVGQE